MLLDQSSMIFYIINGILGKSKNTIPSIPHPFSFKNAYKMSQLVKQSTK